MSTMLTNSEHTSDQLVSIRTNNVVAAVVGVEMVRRNIGDVVHFADSVAFGSSPRFMAGAFEIRSASL